MWNNNIPHGSFDQEICGAPFKHFLETVIADGQVGTYQGHIGTGECSASCPRQEVHSLGNDIIQVVIPYTGNHLTWTFYFDIARPNLAPDLSFCDDYFRPNMTLLSPWDYANPRMLLVWIEELLEIFGDYQRRRIDRHENLVFEYKMMLDQSNLGLCSDDIQVLLSEEADGSVSSVRFLVRLHVNFTELPDHLLKTVDAGPEPTAHLLVVYQGAQCSKITPEVLFNPSARQLFTNKHIQFPQFLLGACLADYLESVMSTIHREIQALCEANTKKMDFLSVVNEIYGAALLEYDCHSYTRASFLFSKNDFRFILHLGFPPRFPQDKPKVLVQSVYHQGHISGTPFEESVTEFKYNPRMSGQEMANEFLISLEHIAKHFQELSMKRGKIFGCRK